MPRKRPDPKPLPERGCHNCKHWHERTEPGEDRYGECRRYPPRIVHDPDDGTWTMSPCTDPDNWCGEQSPRLQ